MNNLKSKMNNIIKIFALSFTLIKAFDINNYSETTNPHDYLKKFIIYARKYDRSYLKDIDTLVDKFESYINNLKNIDIHNEKFKKGEVSYFLSEGPFTDMSLEDFKNKNLNNFLNLPTHCEYFNHHKITYPKEIDWRSKNAITNVKNQGNCGSCWSFSTTGAIEGLTAIATGKLIPLSEQQLVDCSYSNNGCNGGLMTFAFEFIIKNGGLCSENSYEYIAKDNICKSCTVVEGTKINDCKRIKSGDLEGLIYSLSKQPISVGIQADTFSFQHYGGGIYSDPNCFTENINHGVLLVAYTNDTLTIKNSWGETWGEDGYITLAKTDDKNGICGVYTSASFPIK